MKVKYISSACLEINCNGYKILTDPWFTDGIYDGSWFQFSKIDPFKFISKPDLIYISHIHPDHYDPIFLKKLFNKYGEIPILIPQITPNYLENKGIRDGFNLLPTRFFENSKVQIWIEENNTGSKSDIDSALLVKEVSTGQSLLNLNDCIPNNTHIEILKNLVLTHCNRLNILALGYTGAGCYPHTYFDIDLEREELIKETSKRKSYFFDRYRYFSGHFKAEYNLPFAGEYLLGGKLTHLNYYRGVADAFETTLFDEKAIALKNGGSIDLDLKLVKDRRISKYSNSEIFDRFKEIQNEKMDYEKELNLDIDKINFRRLLKSAAINASSKSEVDENYCFVFSIVDQFNNVSKRYYFEINEMEIHEIKIDYKISHEKYSEIIIDYRYLFGLLNSLYHWNNAEIGSQFLCRRYPKGSFNRSVQNYLNFFVIA